MKSAVKKLMNFKQEKLLIQDYCIKVLNLAELANLKEQLAKAHFFRGLYFRDQNRIMMVNFLKNENKLMKENLNDYLDCIA